MSEILTREMLTRSDGVFADIDFEQRLIDVIAVPWDKPARVFWRGDFWTETFERGAFDSLVGAAPGKIRVNREHVKGNTVGKISEIDPSDERGLLARIRIVPGPRGDEVLYLAKEDMISASIGYRAGKPSDVLVDKENRTRRVRSAHLDHLAMVEDPAFKEAQVLAVREDEASGLSVAEGPLPDTPLLDEFLKDPVIAFIMSGKGRS